MRLDQYLVLHRGFTRNKAQQLIKTHLVSIDAKICNKPSFPVNDIMHIRIREDRRVEWVSRSAEKLAGFLEQVSINNIPLIFSHTNCLDVGSSTGGFTQVLLQHGARHVDAVDVGTDQLHVSLRSDPRVSSYEQTDIRDFILVQHDPYDFIVCDASFISLALILDAMMQLASVHTIFILLYKPQFEIGRAYLKKTGVPKDLKIVESKMKEFEDLLGNKQMNIVRKEKSTLIGEAGNQEWIYMIQKNPETIK